MAVGAEHVGRIMAQRVAQEEDRRLREEQDRAYREAEERDRAKVCMCARVCAFWGCRATEWGFCRLMHTCDCASGDGLIRRQLGKQKRNEKLRKTPWPCRSNWYVSTWTSSHA